MHDSQSSAAVAFEPNRARLFGLAYRMLGSRAEAEDVVQEAYVRWLQSDREAIRNAEAWLVTTATRLAIDRLRALKTERDAYPGPWLPEPMMRESPPPPDRHLELASDLSAAFLVLLERLAPEERAAFLLHEVSEADKASLLLKFREAIEVRDEKTLVTLFAPDATWIADGGGRVAASPRPIVGAERIVKR